MSVCVCGGGGGGLRASECEDVCVQVDYVPSGGKGGGVKRGLEVESTPPPTYPRPQVVTAVGG